MLSKKAKYAIKALTYLERKSHEESPVECAAIAEAENIPYKFLESIMRELRGAGMVRSRRGRKGGYKLNKPANDITLVEIMRLFDGPIALLNCVSERFYEKCPECVSEESCSIRKAFMKIHAVTLDILAHEDIAKLSR